MDRSEFRQKYMLSLKGKAYYPVAPRIVEFREDHPDWSIMTEPKQIGDKTYIFAIVQNETGYILATAHKEVGKAQGGAARWPLETAETGAIGRALGLCGYGTIEGGDFDEGEELADAPVQATPEQKNFVPVEYKEGEVHFPTTDKVQVDAVEQLIKTINRKRTSESLAAIEQEIITVGSGLPEGSELRNRLREAYVSKQEKLK